MYFLVDYNGKVTGVRARGPHSSLENEAVRIIKLLPDAKPAILNGKNVTISYSLPIDFFLLTRNSSKVIEIRAGANIYNSPQLKSEIVRVARRNISLNAKKYGEYWMISFDEYIGYIKNEDVTVISQFSNKDIKMEDNLQFLEEKTLVSSNIDDTKVEGYIEEKYIIEESISKESIIEDIINDNPVINEPITDQLLIEESEQESSLVELKEEEPIIKDVEEESSLEELKEEEPIEEETKSEGLFSKVKGLFNSSNNSNKKDRDVMIINENSDESGNDEIKEELEEVREMLTEVKSLIQNNTNTTKVEEKEEVKELDVNDIAEKLISGEITQDEFLSELLKVGEVKNNNDMLTTIQGLRSFDELLNLGILTQSVKLKSDLLKSISSVNQSENNAYNRDQNEGLPCSEIIDVYYSDGRQNIVSKEKFDIQNKTDRITINPIVGSSRSSILVQIKVEGKDMCFDSDSKILLNFRDGSKTEVSHESYDNCDGETIIFLGKIFGEQSFNILNELKYKEVESIRIWMKNSLKTVILSRTESRQLINSIDCLSSYLNK